MSWALRTLTAPHILTDGYHVTCHVTCVFLSAAHVTEEDIRMAEEKFEESKQLAETAMYNLLENDVSQPNKLSCHCFDTLQCLIIVLLFWTRVLL